MIISCDQCDKKFEIESNLIPKEGRLLECGSCNHKWFYKQDIKDKTDEIIIKPQLKNIEEEDIDPIRNDISQIKKLDTPSEKEEVILEKSLIALSAILMAFSFFLLISGKRVSANLVKFHCAISGWLA